MKEEFTPENKELWDLCQKFGGRLARGEGGPSQVKILNMYDAILPFTRHEESVCPECFCRGTKVTGFLGFEICPTCHGTGAVTPNQDEEEEK